MTPVARGVIVAVVQVALYGPRVLLQLATCGLVALACEAAALRLRGVAARRFLADGSVLVTAALLALSVPPLLPWWLAALGTAIAVLLGKHAYGGLGCNPFNPAMVGYAVLLVSFPLEMTRWAAPTRRAPCCCTASPAAARRRCTAGSPARCASRGAAS